MNAQSRSRAVGWILGFCLAVLTGSLLGAAPADLGPEASGPVPPPEPLKRTDGWGAD